MKPLLFLFFSIYCFTSVAAPTCSLNDLFPVKPGMTKFTAINKINSLVGYTKVSDEDELYELDYLKQEGKKARLTTMTYSVPKGVCYTASDAQLVLTFDGDNLYKVEYFLKYSPSSYNEMVRQYNQIVSALKLSKAFKYSAPVTWTDQVEKTQIGEGWSFHNPQKNEDENEGVSVDYKLDRRNQLTRNEITRDLQFTKTENYVLEIQWVDLNFTVQDNRGHR